MTLDDFKNIYKSAAHTTAICDQLNLAQSRIHLSGMAGSSASLIASSVFGNKPGNYLFILPDKEEAAYFFNNLENLHPNEKGTTIMFYPGSYRRPYQIEETDNANIMLRAEVLNVIQKRRKNTLVVTFPEAIVEKVVNKRHLEKNTLDIEVDGNYSIDFINELLLEYEFEKVDYVYEPGQFSVRGGIVDVFSFSNEFPYRIEFFGDDVDSIRSFDTENQLSIKTMKRISIVPNVQKKLLLESRESFLKYIPQNTTVWIKSFEMAGGKIEKGFEKARYAYEQIESELRHLTPDELYISKASFEEEIQQFSLIEFGSQNRFEPNLSIRYNFSPQPAFNKNFDLLTENLNNNSKNNIANIIFAENPKQIERIYSIFEDKGDDVKFTPINIGLKEGFVDKDLKLACYTDHQIFERYHRFRLKEGYSKSQQAFTLKEIQDLQKGDFVVHVDHGVGQFSGLEKIEVSGKQQEAIRLIYQGNDILYVSIHSLHRISKYTGKEGTQPKMNKLGSPVWSNLKSKTKNKVKEIAFDLIKLYAKRKAAKGFAFTPDTYLQTELEASFIYEDTPDQLKATIDVKKDMESDFPMDRLICGDVGFGKTEIAIRAAFKAVADSKQVAILVPTTILCFQHYKNFSERLKDFPCKVDYINRFKSAKKVKETLKKLETGEVDIIIGTHRLVGKDVKFKDIGLLIIDEEQKFGVSVKDKLKTFKSNIDTLTLTATPIPRTLQFSLMSARDLSIINTAPPNRYPVQTEMRTLNEEIIRDAVTYEVQRGGQVFFVNNRIQNIEEISGMIQRLCPDVRIAIGHGQMEGSKLEAIMLDFMAGMYDVLVATTIIESGIDIPNANTIIVNNANHFGLSDLHQLRGRVGRSNKKAFCMLLTPPMHMLTTDARKRLQAIEQFSDLGSGFNIAMRDLDIRGAGDLLGGEQSGFISDIGFDMYQKILNEAIEELKEKEFKDLFRKEVEEGKYVKECQIETDMELIIPDDYVNSISERLSLYRELDDVEDEENLQRFGLNLIDRFGEIPQPTSELLDTIRLRWLAKNIGFERMILKSEKMICYFIANQESAYFQSDKFTRVLNFIRTNPKNCTMTEKKGKLRLSFVNITSIKEALQALNVIETVNQEASY
jgi:transcription-repair coupling factor (superfamily II helicase)